MLPISGTLSGNSDYMNSSADGSTMTFGSSGAVTGGALTDSVSQTLGGSPYESLTGTLTSGETSSLNASK